MDSIQTVLLNIIREVGRDHGIGATGSECLGALQGHSQLHNEFQDSPTYTWALSPKPGCRTD